MTRVEKIYEPGFADATVQAYLAAMGVGDPVMTLLRKTPAGSIRWLSIPEMTESHLATQALDAAAPVMTSGANGFNGHAFDGATARAGLVTAKGAVPIAQSGDSRVSPSRRPSPIDAAAERSRSRSSPRTGARCRKAGR